MSNVKDLYKAHYEFYLHCFDGDRSKHEWAAREIFNLTTYDDYLDNLFVETILEVCKAIYENRTFKYIENQQRYLKYILVCQLLDNFRWIEWGTSIRGAWFQESHGPWGESKDIVTRNEWTDYSHGIREDHVIEAVPFTIENIQALTEFMED